MNRLQIWGWVPKTDQKYPWTTPAAEPPLIPGLHLSCLEHVPAECFRRGEGGHATPMWPTGLGGPVWDRVQSQREREGVEGEGLDASLWHQATVTGHWPRALCHHCPQRRLYTANCPGSGLAHSNIHKELCCFWYAWGKEEKKKKTKHSHSRPSSV